MPDDGALRDAPRTDDTGTGVGRPVVWLGHMILLVGGFALMGAAFTHGNGAVFVAGILLSALASVVPLATGPRER